MYQNGCNYEQVLPAKMNNFINFMNMYSNINIFGLKHEKIVSDIKKNVGIFILPIYANELFIPLNNSIQFVIVPLFEE